VKCDKCGEILNITYGRSVNFCQNCGNKIDAQKTTAAVDSAESALRYISEKFGADVLLGNKVITIFADITRGQLTDEKDLIKILLDKGALDCLREAVQKPVNEQELSIKRAISKLPKFMQGSDDADAMLRTFAAALGWKLPKQHVITNQSNTNKALIIEPKVGSTHKLSGIDWRILAVENGKALLISENVLEERPYHQPGGDVTWESSTMRNYLNDVFYNKLGDIKTAIAETRNSNPNNPWYGTSGGNTTTDKVFLLSLDELVKYFGDSGDLRNKIGTDVDGHTSSDNYCVYDHYNDVRIARNSSGRLCWWWLRSPGDGSDYATFVFIEGVISVCGFDVVGDPDSMGRGGVRPALWLNL